MLRLFIAVPTPPSILPLLADARDELFNSNAEVKWEPTDKLHCTVKFLGDTREDLVQPLTDVLTRVASSIPPFSVRYAGTGCFPGVRDPRIIWAGIEDPEGGLASLFKSIENAVCHLGFGREPRAFHPHVTLGRVKGRHRIGELLETMETVTLHSPPVTIQQIELIQSTLKPGGSEYGTIASVRLKGPGKIDSQ